jgi:PHYB activation tagged suppressor 1
MITPANAALALGAAVLAYVTFTVYRLIVKPYLFVLYYRAQGIKGAPFKPFVGDMLELNAQMQRNDPFYMYLDRFRKEYGPVHNFCLGPLHRLRVTSPDLVREVLVTQSDKFHKASLQKEVMGTLLGDSILLSEGAVHGRNRAIIAPAFHFERLHEMVRMMVQATQSNIDQWLSSLTDKDATAEVVVDVAVALSSITLSIVGKSSFDVDTTEGNGKAMYEMLDLLLAGAETRVRSLTGFLPGYMSLPLPHIRRIFAKVAELKAHLHGVIEARKAKRKAIVAAGGSVQSSGLLLDFLLDAQIKDPVAMSDEQILDEALTFITAGHETTSQALCWTMLLLAQYPEWKDRARAEVLACLGKDRVPSYEDLSQMPAVLAILQESMRLYPPVPQIAREAAEDCVLGQNRSTGEGGIRVCKGTGVVVPFFVLHRDPELWGPTAAEFDPSRFLSSNHAPSAASNGAHSNGEAGADAASFAAAARHKLAFLPFSMGPRNCVGQNFALLEGRIILALLLQRLDWTVDPSYHHCPTPRITLRPRDGMPLRIRKLA